MILRSMPSISSGSENQNRLLAENTGKPIETIEQDTERDNWLTADEAKEYGLIDAVIKNHEG